jgi:geranylgeranyl diphosphate synthase type II
MNTALSLHDYLRERRVEVETALASALPTSPDSPTVVADAMRYSLDAGGKRLRPILCLASAEAVAVQRGDDPDEARALALPAACALELIHTYSLVHDDLPAMDNDTMRRGKPTLHVVAGEGMAILAGDGLLTEAFALMARAPASSDPAIVDRKLRVIGIVATAAGAVGMVGGQALDLAMVPQAVGSPVPIDADSLRVMHAKKTGALITAAAVAGSTMGGGDRAAVATIRSCAERFGLAFQIVDDILDVEGASADMGKTLGKDAAAGKPTYPAIHGIEASRRMAHDCIAQAETTLARGGLDGTRLGEIGRWIVERTN